MPYNNVGKTAVTEDTVSPDVNEQDTETRKKRKGERMDEDEIQNAVVTMIQDARLFLDSELSTFRAKTSDYYMGMPFGNEEAGRSQAVITIVRDTIHGVMPSLLRIFFGGERYVEYWPRNVKQIEWADQVTAYISDIVMMQDNEGFTEFYSWFKDALLKRIGIMRWYHDETTTVTTYQTTNYSIDEITALHEQEGVELIEGSVKKSKLATPGNPTFDLRYKRTDVYGKNRFVCVPPDEFLYSRASRSIHQAQMIGYQCEKTKGELVAMGVDEDIVEEWGHKDVLLEMNAEETSRQKGNQQPTPDEGLPESNARVYYAELYPYLDVDGDGINELVKICVIGPSFHMVEDPIPVEERPFAVICPDPEPHAIEGLGFADYTMDIQKIVSMITRAMHDSLALAVTNRMIYVEGMVSAADVRNTEIGAPVRAKDINAVREIPHSFLGQQALPVLEYWDNILKKRTGVINGTNGLDADSLQSTTQTAVNAAVQDAQAQIEMVARIFAETGVKQLMKGLLRLVIEHPEPDRVMRSQGKWIPVDPRVWDANLDVGVNVALGTGSIAERVAVLTDTADRQKELAMALGPDNPVAGLNDYSQTLVKRLRVMGRKDAELFFHAAPPGWKPPQQPDPNTMIAQAEQMKAQAQTASAQAKVQLDAEKAQIEEMRRALDLKLEQEKAHLEDDRLRDQMELDAALKIEEMTLKFGAEKERDAQQHAQAEAARLSEPLKRTRRVKVEHDPATGAVTAYDISEDRTMTNGE